MSWLLLHLLFLHIGRNQGSFKLRALWILSTLHALLMRWIYLMLVLFFDLALILLVYILKGIVSSLIILCSSHYHLYITWRWVLILLWNLVLSLRDRPLRIALKWLIEPDFLLPCDVLHLARILLGDDIVQKMRARRLLRAHLIIVCSLHMLLLPHLAQLLLHLMNLLWSLRCTLLLLVLDLQRPVESPTLRRSLPSVCVVVASFIISKRVWQKHWLVVLLVVTLESIRVLLRPVVRNKVSICHRVLLSIHSVSRVWYVFKRKFLTVRPVVRILLIRGVFSLLLVSELVVLWELLFAEICISHLLLHFVAGSRVVQVGWALHRWWLLLGVDISQTSIALVII